MAYRTGERDLALCNTALESLDALLMFDLVDLLQVVSPAHAEVENRHLQDCDVEVGSFAFLSLDICQSSYWLASALLKLPVSLSFVKIRTDQPHLTHAYRLAKG